MIKQCILIAILIAFSSSCTLKNENDFVNYSTKSDSALFYYNKGWEEIMDFGDYSTAEISYRKSLSFDEDFLVGKSVLARLTLSLDERLALYETLENKKDNIVGDERLILDVYIALTKYTNLRDQKLPEAKKALQEAFRLSENNFSKIVHKFPQEVYLKSEYIEVIHALYGAQSALDTLNFLTTKTQRKNPFILGYKAILTAEIKNYDEALRYALRLAKILKDKKVAKPDAILADIYFKMQNYKRAKIHADKAYQIDPKNLDASRLKTKIDKLIN